MPHKPPEPTQMDWVAEVKDCLKDFIDEYTDSIVQQVKHGKTVIIDQDFYLSASEYIHEKITHKFDLSISEAADLINTLEDYEETDEGLWQGERPSQAIRSMAAATFTKAFIHAFNSFSVTLREMPLQNRRHATIISNIKSALNYTIQTWR